MSANNPVPFLLKAVVFAAEKHRLQRRKDDETPYINHPLKVAEILADAGETNTDLLVAAILHDTVEDTETTIEEVCEQFGERVAALVMEVTHDEGLSSAERKRLEVERIASRSHPAKLIKLADKISNVRDFDDHPPKWDVERMMAYREFASAFWTGCSGLNHRLDRIAADLQVTG